MSDMTSAMAIDLLDNLIGMVEDNQENDYDTALHMAIDALKAQADGDTISRKAAIDAIVAQTIGYTVDEIKAECEENIFNENGYLGGLKDAINAIEDMPSAQPEKRTEERTETHGVCLDAIDRQATIDAVCEELDSIDHVPQWVFDRLTKKIENLPPAQPETKRCDTCRHEKSQWFNRCADCSDYELWEGKEE